MTLPQSIQQILEFLQKSKMNLLVHNEEIINNYDTYHDLENSSKIESYFTKSLKFLDKITESSDILIDFWEIIRTLMGGLRIQKVKESLVDPKGNLLVDVKSLGINLLGSHLAKPFLGISPLESLLENSWYELLSLLQGDSNFIDSAKKLKSIQNQIKEKQITQKILSFLRTHPTLSEEDKEEFTIQYRKTQISIQEFLKQKYPDQKVPVSKPKITGKVESEPDFDNYKMYLEANEREIARMRRTGEYSVRKRGKKRKRSKSS